ncbi:MAG: TonB-dependent receptor [Ignavibacteria bacterium]|nr:TonB-dependent receptor [Ignavibacteria bacterium]
MRNTRTQWCVMVLVALCCSAVPAAWSQGVTTAAMNGSVHDKAGQVLPGANVIAVHLPTGTTYGTSTRSNGRYNLANMRVGGPYTLTVSYVGYKTRQQTDIVLQLSQDYRADFFLEETSVTVGAMDIVGERNAVLSASRTGAAQNVTKEQIERLPTVSRSFTDFIKLTPQFVGNSAAGRNNRFNNVQIDGTQYNDIFGLGSSGTPGGQAFTTPISLDALQEFQVVVAPYDVRQGGFTGGGINAITRSGTNTTTGSVFGYFRNDKLLRPELQGSRYAKFQDYQVGFRAGGPVIENTLFFFVNGEITDRKAPTDVYFTEPGRSPSSNVSVIPKDSVAKFTNLLKGYGYDPGSADNLDLKRQSAKFFARLDYNLSENHRLTLRHNFVSANDDNLPRTTARFFFENSNYIFNNSTHSTVLQFNSTFSNRTANELVVGYTRIRDFRETVGGAFPFIRIKFTGADLYAGTENFSIKNQLDQDIIEVTDNFTAFLGDHTITAGTHNEFFSFRNLFIRDFYGNYEFNNLTDFAAGRPSRYTHSYSKTANPEEAAKFSAMQIGGYVQDEWSGIDRLKLTFGVRMDVPMFPDKPAFNAKIDTVFGVGGIGTDKVPDASLLFSPRLGFNWDVTGDRTTQVRGGAGVFSGRVAYVWVSNQYGNTGVEFGRVDVSNRPAGFFTTDVANQPRPGVTPGLSAVSTSEVNLTDKDFKMPQLARLNLAVDQQLPFGIIGTLEGLYSKAMNDMLYQDINLGAQKSTLASDGRPVYGTYDATRKTFTAGKVSSAFTNVILMKNTDQGYQYSVTAQLQRQLLDGIIASCAYTFGESKDVNSVLSSQAFSQWRYNHVPGDPNNPPLGYSAFDIRHRVFATISWKKEFFENWATTFSVYYNGQSGQPFSYVYDGDVNGDGQVENDLLYVPKDAGDILLTTNNYDKLDAWIQSDQSLQDARGTIVDRMGSRMPWQDVIDLRIAQEVPIPSLGGHRFEVTLDVLNVLNLMNPDWGRVKFVDQQRFRLLKFQGLDATTQKPTFSFDASRTDPYDLSSLASRWQMQIGLRYTF